MHPTVIKTSKQNREILPRVSRKEDKGFRTYVYSVKFKVKSGVCGREHRNPEFTSMGCCWREPDRGSS